MDTRQILDEAEATVVQRQWVKERLDRRTDADAARAIGLHPGSVYSWDNKKELDRAVELLLADAVESARFILRETAAEAARTLERNLRYGRQQVQAANSVLDRVDVVATKKLEIEGETKHVIVIKQNAED